MSQVRYMFEILKLTPFFRSKFGRFRLPDPPGKPPEPWESVVRRLPALDPEEGREHIRIFLKGRTLPYTGLNLRRSGPIMPWIYFEFCGPPKAAKTVALNGLHTILRKLQIPYVMYPELRRLDIPEFRDPALENVWRFHKALNSLIITHDEHVSGHGYLNRMRNFIFKDLGIMNSLMFADAFTKLTGTSSYADSMESSASPYIDMLGAVTLLHVPPETSIARGSRLGAARLDALSRARIVLPERMERMTRANDRPLLFFNIDSSTWRKKDLPQFILRTYGTVIRDWIQG